MSVNPSSPITLREQIDYCSEEITRWQRCYDSNLMGKEALIRLWHYWAIRQSLYRLESHHDLATTQEIEPVTVTMCPGYGVEVSNDK